MTTSHSGSKATLPAALDQFIASLPRFNDTGGQRKFYISKVADDPSVAFQLVEKVPRGQGDNGSQLKTWGRLTYRQCNQINRTSANIEEIVERFRMHIFEGIDTTREAGRSGFNPEQARDIETRVRELLESKLDELIDKRLAQRATDTMPRGIQPPPPSLKNPGPRQKDAAEAIEAEWELWRTRATEMGINEPLGRKRDRHIDGRWLRSAKKLWAAHKSGKDVSGHAIKIGKDGANDGVIEKLLGGSETQPE